MTVGKKMSRISGERIVEIDAGMRKFAKNRRAQAKRWSKEIARALMGENYAHPAWNFFANST